ncbi:MAG: hypothetical protein IPI00_14845 [Flavobacteriales bacterium]|nr:hypothetical protein [Flavobacteriales bacterium]
MNAGPTTLIVVAKKIENISQFQTPQQSDYVDAWDTVRSVKTGVTEAGRSKTLNIYRRMMPLHVKIILRNLYDIFTKEKIDDADLGTIDPKHFKKIELAPTKALGSASISQCCREVLGLRMTPVASTPSTKQKRLPRM